MAYKLVIVESPAKAKTITKYLPKGCKVQATMGHIIDLPKKDIGIDIENNFEPTYKTIYGKAKILNEIKKSAKSAEEIILATDPDREGEAISWHLANALNLDLKDNNRIEFHEITPRAISEAMNNKRPVNMDLVDAQQARRVLDRLVGYKISPVLWKKIMRGLSAGRVQSVATRLIIDREEEIKAFKSEEYWNIDALFKKESETSSFEAKLNSIDSKKAEISDKEQADLILKELEYGRYIVEEIKKGSKKKTPPTPFTTSTLQQDAFRKLGFSTKKTMMIAQQLYEGIEIAGRGHVGLITYLRTDSIRLSEEAKEMGLKFIEDNYGREYLGHERRKKTSQGKVQDAHEAIRPTDVLLNKKELEKSLNKDQLKLYELIYNRFVASLMADANYDTLRVDIKNGKYIFRANGAYLKFAGFLKVYQAENKEENLNNIIPNFNEGEEVILDKLLPKQKFTQPPARYSEASLVKILEEKGIGRPSTYAPTIATIINRGYVVLEEKKFKPTDLGYAVNKLMTENFSDVVDYNFTAKMENDLDKVAYGNADWHDVIKEFYDDLKKDLDKADDIERIKLPEVETDEICEKCGRKMVIKTGRFGKFLACPGFPECSNTKAIVNEIDAACPKCGGKVVLRKSKKGRNFYGCKNYPECDFISWDKPTEEKCPNCGKELYEKNNKSGKTLYCADKECGYIRQEN